MFGSHNDVTNFKLAQIAIQEREEQFRTVFDKAADAIFIADMETGVILDANENAAKLMQMPKDKIIGIHQSDLHPKSNSKYSISSFKVHIQELSEFGFSTPVENSLVCADGSLVPVEILASKILYKGRNCLMGIFRDITERKKAEKELAHSYELMKYVIEHTQSSIAVHDTEMNYIYVSDRYYKDLKLTNRNIIGRNHYEIFPDLPQYLRDVHQRSLKGEVISGTNDMFVHSDGQVDWANWQSRPWYKADGSIGGIIIYIEVITDRVKAENELKTSEENYRYLFENNPHPMWIYDLSNFKFLAVNNTAIQKYGYSKDEFLSMTLYDIRPEYEWNKLKDSLTDELDEIQKSGPWKHKLKTGKIILVNIISHRIDFQGIEARLVIADDVTEKIKAEQSLIESEKKLRTFLDTSIEGICAADKNDIITFVNPRFAKLLEYNPDDLLNKNFQDLISPEDLSNYSSQQKLREKGYSEIFELKLKTKFGKKLWFLISASPLFDESGNFAGSFGMFTDITEMKFAEEKIKESERRFRSIWENSFDAMRLTDKNGIIVDVNNAFCNLFDTPKDEIIGEQFYKLYSEHNENNALKNYKESFASGNIKPIFEAKLKLWQNEEKWVSISTSFISDENGNKLLLSIFRDITEHKLAEEEIRILYRGIEHSPASVVITDQNGFIQYVNPKFCEVTGYSLNELIGEKPSIISSGLTAPEVYQELWYNITNGRVWKGEFLNKKKNGDLFWESALISPILDDKGQICNYIGIKEDITDKKKLYEELIIAKEKAEESNRLKSSFLANMSHELRTPLIGILGYSEILMEDAKDDLITEKASIIFKSGRRLLETLNFILDYSKLESEKIEVKFESIEVINAIKEIVNLHRPTAIKKNLELIFDTSVKEFYFKTDLKLFNSILNNLINNAIKFTTKGNVKISFDFTSIENKKYICIIVEDTGIGISKEKQTIIWEPFRQLSEGKARSFEGTGLGLTLVKKYVELLNGFIELESEPSVGSKFSIILPCF
jgi:PAS domain S-box-containing protein